MKKEVFLILALVIGIIFMAGCSEDPVIADFENYLNVEMVQANANYAKITTEMSKWTDFETDEQLNSSITEILIPICDETLDLVKNITPATSEVQAVKKKFVKVIQLYKESFTLTAEYIENPEDDKLELSNTKLEEGLKMLEEYNKDLEVLAALSGSTVEY